jgi:hypothetical protein
MKKVFIILVVSLVVLGLAVAASCIPRYEFTDVATSVRTSMYPTQVEKKFKLRVGTMMILAAKFISQRVTDTPEIAEYLGDIKNAQIGIYDVKREGPSAALAIPAEADQGLMERGWEPFVRVRDHGQQVSLFYKAINDRIAGVYAIVLAEDKLVVVEVQGKLDSLIEKALQQRGLPDGLNMS